MMKISVETKQAKNYLKEIKGNLDRIVKEGGMPTKRRIFKPIKFNQEDLKE